MRNAKWTKVLAFGFLAALLVAPAFGQTTRGGIEGVVQDVDGGPLPGVSAVISSPNLQGTRTTATDDKGKFRFLLLPPGVYEAVFSLEGFQTVEQTNVYVAMEEVVKLQVTMTTVFTESIITTADSPVLDVTSTSIGSSFSEELLTALPAGRDFKSVTFMATGAVEGGNLANEELQNSPAIMGASALENRYVIDELDTTDPAYGHAGTNLSFNFIDEIAVKTGGYEAEYGGALGGVINMVTKSGSNEIHGEVFGNFSNDSLWETAKIPETRGTVKTVDTEWDLGFTVGGKFIEDKLWYFLAYDRSITEQNIRNDVFVGDDVLQSNEFIRDFERDYYIGKLTWAPNSNNSLIARLIGDPYDITNDYYSANYVDSPFAETNQHYDRSRGGDNLALTWNSIFTEDTFLEVMVGRNESSDEYVPALNATNYQDQTSDGRWTLGAGGSSYFGGSGFQQPKDGRTRDQARLAFSWFIGEDHEVKLGGRANFVEFDMDYNVAGPSAAFCARTSLDNPWFGGAGAWAFDHDTGDYVLLANNCDANGDGILDGIMMPDRVGNRFRLRNGYYYNRNYKNESMGETDEYSLFIQDSWRVTDYLTLNLGLRAESSESVGDLTRVMPERTLDFSFDDMLAPRAGFVWDVAQNGRSKVFGHYGRFYQSIPLDINVRSLGSEEYDFVFYEYPESGLPTTDNSGYFMYYVSSRSEYTVIDPDVKPQYLEEYVFGGEYEVMTNLAVGAKYIRRELGRVIEDISVDNGNTYFVTNPGGTFDFNPGTGTPLDEPVDFPEAERNFTGVEASVHKRLSNRWQLYASLMWSELEGNYEGLYSRDNQQIDPNITSKFDLPDLLLNADGILQNDREWQFKAYGSYHFDLGLITGFNFFYFTGEPISKLGAHPLYGLDERFVTSRGSEGRTDDWWNLDLHLSYPFRIGDTELHAVLDVFNVFDEQVAVEVDQRWTVFGPGDEADAPGGDIDAQTNDTWGDPLVYSRPRNIRLGVKFSW